MQPQHRLRARADFERARRRGRFWSSALLGLTVVRNDLDLTRCGFAVSRRVGKAVVRNRVRRRLREMMRGQLPHLARGWDLVFSARPPAASATSAELSGAVSDLLHRARVNVQDPKVHVQRSSTDARVEPPGPLASDRSAGSE